MTTAPPASSPGLFRRGWITWVDIAAQTLGAGRDWQLRMVEGYGRGSFEDDRVPSFEAGLADIHALVDQGVITAADRKCRYDGCRVTTGPGGGIELDVRIGPSHYDDAVRDMLQPEQTAHLARLGEQRHCDPRRYLACGIGVLVLPTSADGRVLLGIRSDEVYAGWAHGPVGWLPFDPQVERIDAAAHALVECKEELDLTDLGPLTLLGLISYSATFETEIVFTAIAGNGVLEDLVDRRTWTQAIDACEHADVFLVEPGTAIEQNAHGGRPLVPGTGFGLRALLEHGSQPKFVGGASR